MNMIQPILDGDRLSLSRILTHIENNTPTGRYALTELFQYTGRAHLIGVTGAPGTGKSTLVNQIAYHFRHPSEEAQKKSVAVVAVDPSSPFSGGAVLGDRIRMRSLAGDQGVFIRSMASRGSLGGLATTTAGIVQAFDAAGFDIILIETVGAGQAEVDIARLAHTTLVIEAPGLGDDIQAIKAGILEIADILIVNKADLPGVESTERALRSMLQLAKPARRVFKPHGRFDVLPEPEVDTSDYPPWSPRLLRVIATEGTGVPELLVAIENHRGYLDESGELGLREKARIESNLVNLLQDSLMDEWQASLSDGLYEKVLEELVARRLSPHEAVLMLIDGGKK
jgi:LAO/AO transport system kinase